MNRHQIVDIELYSCKIHILRFAKGMYAKEIKAPKKHLFRIVILNFISEIIGLRLH